MEQHSDKVYGKKVLVYKGAHLCKLENVASKLQQSRFIFGKWLKNEKSQILKDL